ncbi:SGNH/GDSL hydrolase family protein [Roseomonas sp. CAU 1739]|uniref:SGNH/GDSL hydrolase family protein n=1 Tax=Roseomonas sp. CAU 1739 TaxID=3140364 RepID=UPI00325B9E08
MRGILALLVGLIFSLPAAAAQGPGCGAPEEWLQSPPLPATATGIATGRLSILAVGTASVTGAGTSSPAAAWPARLEALLRERRPNLQLRFEVRGTRGSTAADQWRQIEEAMRAGPLDLVIWQAATTEALRSLPMDDMAAIIGPGLDRLHARGIDAVLMGIQFSRFLRANVDVDPYRDALRVLAGAGHAGYFSRYDIMRAWAEAGTVDVERAARDRRTAEVDTLNDCLARALAAFIRDGVEEARR